MMGIAAYALFFSSVLAQNAINSSDSMYSNGISLTMLGTYHRLGDNVTIGGTFFPDSIIELDLHAPNGTVVQHEVTKVDKDGRFSSFDLKIPANADSGKWNINATSGSIFEDMQFAVDPMSPMEQFRSGVLPKDIVCSQQLELVIKSSDNSPACVRYTTASFLIERGWAKETVPTTTSLVPSVIIPTNSSIRSNGYTFTPQTTKVVIGTNNTIRWINMDSVANDVTFDDRSFRSGIIEPGIAWAHTFDKAGTIGYHSDIHPWLTGTVIVIGNPSQIANHGPQSHPFGPRIHLSRTNSIRDASFIKLLLTTNSTIIRQGQTIGLDISLNNTAPNKLVLNSDNNWGLPDLSFEPCIPRPYGIAVFDGYYTEQNMTDGRPLLIFNPVAMCPSINSTKIYVFEPESTNATASTCSDSNLPYCTYSQDMQDKISISGTWEGDNLQPFKAGVYTLVGGDEWGHLAIQHFAVTNSTIFAGNLGGMSCPAVQFGIDTKIENTTGFTLYSSSRYIDNLVLAAGNTGHLTLTYNYSRPTNGSPDIVGKPLNLTNYGVLAYMANVMSQKSLLAQYEITISPDLPWQSLHVCHYDPQIGGQSTPCYTDQYKIISQIGPGPIPYNPGINVDIEPKWIMISPNSTSTFTATISANKTALPGSYWVSLGHGYCGPSQMIELAIQ